jgi:dihydrofolate reductase
LSPEVSVPKLRVHALSVSLDGFVAGPDQGPATPLGVGGERLHEWVFATRTGRAMIGRTGGSTGIDDEMMAAGFTGIGATIMGRNMFGPVRGPWPDDDWRGWWGLEPPYHHDVFVLTHQPRASFTMAGGTTFHFTGDPLAEVRDRAFAAAGGADVRLGGGAATVRAFLRAGLVDEMQYTVVPTLLGRGEPLFDPADDLTDRYRCRRFTPSDAVAHVVLEPTELGSG